MKSKFKAGAIELAQPCHHTSDLELLGPEGITPDHPFGAKLSNNGEVHVDYSSFTSDQCSFKSIIGTEYRCFYAADEFFQEEKAIVRERGIASVVEREGKFFLQREIPIAWSNDKGEQFPLGPNQHVQFGGGDYIVVLSLPPPTYLEALVAPNSVIASTSESNPTPVELEHNSLLGRKDDVIQAIDMNELGEMMEGQFFDKIFNDLIDSQKQLDFKARHIRLTRKNASIAAPVIRALPRYSDTEKPPTVEGNIVYNTDSKCLQYYDGTKWRSLSCSEEA